MQPAAHGLAAAASPCLKPISTVGNPRARRAGTVGNPRVRRVGTVDQPLTHACRPVKPALHPRSGSSECSLRPCQRALQPRHCVRGANEQRCGGSECCRRCRRCWWCWRWWGCRGWGCRGCRGCGGCRGCRGCRGCTMQPAAHGLIQPCTRCVGHLIQLSPHIRRDGEQTRGTRRMRRRRRGRGWRWRRRRRRWQRGQGRG